ncbi:unnamed protein product [Linum trigynum]|uniref:Uncharacterized protein n=1 Tax=Linum trigynum TaxID=586398 RepID=A0AAV2DGH1_9ROSI
MRQTRFVPSRSSASTLKPQWCVINTLLTHSLYPSYMCANKITVRALLAFTSMTDPSSQLHLGSNLATSFSRALSGSRCYVTSLGPYITHLARHFNVNLECCKKGGRSIGFGEDTLRAMKLLRVFGPFCYIEGLSLPPSVPPQEKPPTRAPGHRRRPLAPPLSVASSSGAGPSTSRRRLEERVDRFEAYYVGVTTRIDRTIDLVERMARGQGVLSDDE